MTTEERYEFERRVALAMGWTQTHGACGRPPGKGIDYPSEFFPHFAKDPAAADMVRQEIGKRLWDYKVQSTVLAEARYRYQAQILCIAGFPICAWQYADSPHVALCLAFLAACEAPKNNT